MTIYPEASIVGVQVDEAVAVWRRMIWGPSRRCPDRKVCLHSLPIVELIELCTEITRIEL
jgi:hypothetical protein